MKKAGGFTPALRAGPGFTLIEVLVSLAIFSIVITTIYSAFRTGMLAYNKIDAAFNIYQSARITLNRLEQDLKQAVAYKEDASGFKGGKESLGFFALVDSFSRDGKSNSNFCRVKYELDNGILKRACLYNLEALESDSGIGSDELSSDVGGLSFWYAYATDNPDKPYEWRQSWPVQNDESAEVKGLPLAVKIELTLKQAALSFTKVVPLNYHE